MKPSTPHHSTVRGPEGVVGQGGEIADDPADHAAPPRRLGRLATLDRPQNQPTRPRPRESSPRPPPIRGPQRLATRSRPGCTGSCRPAAARWSPIPGPRRPRDCRRRRATPQADTTLTMKMSTLMAIMKAPAVEIRFQRSQPSRRDRCRPGAACRSCPVMCIGKKVTWKPMKNSQKFHLPSALGHQCGR
jgi:hypothetical protein